MTILEDDQEKGDQMISKINDRQRSQLWGGFCLSYCLVSTVYAAKFPEIMQQFLPELIVLSGTLGISKILEAVHLSKIEVAKRTSLPKRDVKNPVAGSNPEAKSLS